MSASEGAQPAGRRGAKAWLGYAWFMSLGMILPLPIFLAGYICHVTLVGAPVARRLYAFGVFLSTMGQPAPAGDRVKAKTKDKGAKKPFWQRLRPYSPPGLVERHGRPFSTPVRAAWFVFVGWWLGAFWVVAAWSILLLPYPFPDVIRRLLGELPSVMTLAQAAAPAPRPSQAEEPVT
jgi:uncharacterized membrane protein YccF (DUF307 family)